VLPFVFRLPVPQTVWLVLPNAFRKMKAWNRVVGATQRFPEDESMEKLNWDDSTNLIRSKLCKRYQVVVVLPDPFRGMRMWRNSTETQQSGDFPRFGPEVKNGSSAKDGALERLKCGTIQKEVRSCRGYPQAMQDEFSRFILHR